MTGPPIAYALVSGLKAYDAGAVVDLVTHRELKCASLPCCDFALLGGLQGIGSYSRSPLGAHAHREIPSGVPFLGDDFQFDALPALFTLDHASPVAAFCRLPPGFSRVNGCRPFNQRPAEGPAKRRILSFGHRRPVL
jgi:hypothetical protein